MKKLLLFLFCACFSVGMYAADFYVDGAIAASGDGTSWEQAKKTIPEALTLAKTNNATSQDDNIYVKAGTYTGATAATVPLDLTHVDCTGISLFGGYAAASSGTDVTQRNISSNVTIVDAQAGANAVKISQRVIVDGFTIQNGKDASFTQNAVSAGVAISHASAVVSNCIIKNCSRTTTNYKSMAGGVFIKAGTLRSSEIFGNSTTHANSQGGGIQITGGTIEQCKIYNNTSGATGQVGGILVAKSSTNTNIYSLLDNNITLSNNIIYNNAYQGIKINIITGETKTVSLTNNTIVNNGSICSVGGAGVATLTATNNIFYNNGGNETIQGTYTFNAIQAASVSGSGNVAITATDNSQTAFVSPSAVTGYNAVIPASVTNANWNLGSSSVCLNSGTGSGNGLYDVAGSARVVGPIDMGAYESNLSSTASDYFRSKGTGNWADLTSWKSSTDNSTWMNASLAPTSSATAINVLLGHEITVAAAATASTLSVNAGGKLTLNSGITLSAANFNLKSSATDSTTATFKDLDGTLSVSGTTNVEQYLTTSRNWYVSSPISAATSNVFAADATNPLYYYVETTPDAWSQITNTTTDLTVGKGYIASINSDRVVTFTGGTLNTGAQSITGLTSVGATFTGCNLVGNPYPSYYDWDNATKTNVGTSVWYRSKSTGAYLFQTYNSAGGASTNGGSNLIPPMQAYWVKVTAGQTGSIGLSNAYRSHQDQSVATNRLKAPSQLDTRKQLRLEVSNGINFDEALIYANANAQDGFDTYDSDKMFGNSAEVPEIFTVLGNEKLAINGVNDFAENQQMALGFKTTAANTFSIKASEVKNFAADTKIILIDNQMPGQEFDLTDGAAYSFTSDVANDVTRFSLIFRAPGGTTGVPTTQKMNAQVFVNTANQLSILAPASCNYAVYNLVGQKVATGRTTATHQLQSGVYVVKVTENGRSFTSKVLVN